MHEVGGLASGIVEPITGVKHGAGRGQPGDHALETGAEHMGIGEAQGAGGARLALEGAAGDLLGRAGEGLGLVVPLVGPTRQDSRCRRRARSRSGQKEDGPGSEEQATGRASRALLRSLHIGRAIHAVRAARVAALGGGHGVIPRTASPTPEAH